jgi:hypothetical protein
MKLSNAQLTFLKYLKDHNHPHESPSYWRGRLKVHDDLRHTRAQSHKVDERTVLRLWSMGLVEFSNHSWQEDYPYFKSFLRANIRLTPKGLDAWLEGCEHQPEYRSL